MTVNGQPRALLYWCVNMRDNTPHLMRVTRVTPHRVYGSIDAISTHCHPRDAHGVYHSETIAKKVVAEISEAASVWERRREQKRAELALIELNLDRTIADHLERINEHKQSA